MLVITLGELSTEISNIESNVSDNKLQIGLNLNELNHLDSRTRMNIIQRFLKLFGRYIVTLGLKFHGEEYYLLQNQFRLPNLKTLFVSPSGYGMFPIATESSCQILQQLLIIYGQTLKTLEVNGVWNYFHVYRDVYYPVEALETLNLTKSYPAALQSLLILYGSYISTLEIYDVWNFANDEIEGEECFLPNIKHLHIDADTLAFIELVRCNTKRIESLIVYLDDPEMDYDPGYLNEFKNLKLLEVNCPMVLNAILESCNRKLRYLYVPEQGENAADQVSLSPVNLPGLKDLCVRGSKKWSVDMIRKHCESLENLIIFGFMELEEFRNCEDFEHDNEYHWPDLAALNCRFPKMKKLFLPDCTDNGIIQRLKAKCPANVEVNTGKKEVGEAVAARIKQSYSYTRYKRMMHRDLSSLFEFN
jgi:hypothetical protein